LAPQETELTQEAVPPVNGYDPVFVAESLNDRNRSRLDDEEVAAHLARGKQNLAGLDLANATQLAQSRQLVVIESGECAVAVDALWKSGSDPVVHG
jgi:hypothetical protein